MKIIEVTDRTPDLIGQLLDVWEASVRATHIFLTDGEISSIKAYVPQALAATAAVREPAYDKSVRFRKKRGRSRGGDCPAAGEGPLRTGRQAASSCGFVKTAAQVPAVRLFCIHTSTARLFPHPATERTLCFWAPACLCMRYLS